MKRKFVGLIYACSFLAFVLNGQVPYMIKDVHTGTASAAYYGTNWEGLTPLNNGIIATAYTTTTGIEPLVTDGTSPGTYFLDINPGAGSSNPSNYFHFNNKFFMFADDGTNGLELWTSDGTVAGTSLFKNTIAGSDGLYSSSWPIISGNKFFLVGNSSSIGKELYVSDGTVSGTTLVKDIWPGAGSGMPAAMLSDSSGKTFFIANDGVTGQELWVSDGSSSGTFLLKDIYPGTGSSNIKTLKFLGGYLFFLADDGVNGQELWRTDGTTAGTILLKDVTPGSASSYSTGCETINNKLVIGFSNVIWETDGTPIGTIPGYTLSANGPCSNFYKFNNELYIFDKSPHFMTFDDTVLIYKFINGAVSGSKIAQFPMHSYGGSTYYSANYIMLDTQNNEFLFLQSDPTFYYYQDMTIGLSDGTAVGTKIVSYNAGDGPTSKIPFLNNNWLWPIYTTSSGLELHSIDASGNDALVKDIDAGFAASIQINPSSFDFYYCNYSDKLYFTADDGNTGLELYETDGTNSGTKLLLDIMVGSGSCFSNVQVSGTTLNPHIIANSNKIFFWANDGIHGSELWSMNTIAGIHELNDESSHFILFPNPGSTKVNLRSEREISSVCVTDAFGKTVYQRNAIGQKDVIINTENLCEGVYFVSFEGNDWKSETKFVKIQQ